MIARIWNGTTNVKDFEAYSEFMLSRAIPDYEKTQGFIRLTFLRRVEGEIGHFKLITYWESLDVIKNFAGNDILVPKYYPEDKIYLLNFEQKVTHFEVFGEKRLFF